MAIQLGISPRRAFTMRLDWYPNIIGAIPAPGSRNGIYLSNYVSTVVPDNEPEKAPET